MEELLRLAFIEGYKQRALSGKQIFDATSRIYADALFDKWIKQGQELPISNVVGRSEQLLAVAEYVYNNFDDSSSKTAKDYLQDFLSQ